MVVFPNVVSIKSKILLTLLASAVIATAGDTAPSAKARRPDNEISVKAYLQGTVRGEPQGQPPTTVSSEGQDTGLSEELGPFKIIYRFTITFPPGSSPSDPSTSAGSAEWILPNGDSIYTKFAGIGDPADSYPIVRVVEFYQVSGGTGRFANAQGRFTVKRLSSNDPSAAANLTLGVVEGTIALHRAVR
jgi:hypothetical protein